MKSTYIPYQHSVEPSKVVGFQKNWMTQSHVDQLPLDMLLLTCWIFFPAHGPVVGTSNSTYIYVVVLYLELPHPLRNCEAINIVSLSTIYGVHTLKSMRAQS